MPTRRHFVQLIGTSATSLSLAPLGVLAQGIDQVRILYGFPAGSSGDSVARRVGEKLAGTAYTRNAAVVENKPGASGRIALETLKTAPADGSVLAMAPVSAMANYPFIYPRLAYDPKDFAPVSIAAIAHHGLAVGPLVPASVKTVRDFLAWCKGNAAQAHYGSPGAGSTPHFLGALLGLNSGTELRHVPYRGSVPGVVDVVGGQIAAMVTTHGDFLQNHRAGKLRILGTSGPRRSPFVPEVPTFAEQGFPELTTEEWFGFYAPARTPADVVAAANAAITGALKDKAVQDGILAVGLIPHGSSIEEMVRWQRSEVEAWRPLIRKIGFTAES
ncbi:tripartite tricarboxylate transporter substrate-binding protein [Hydrogenophaga sp. SL48]|uniref:tripartite tricarboxylate transporter substrate-binding protein n=1 Tax=Hydrogenophaga sp. SL48 TaxID=2806347 RepID=UPI001F4003F1|nr:tripartite tricarboxylate transporter substrate-binding protein [Hydrogenophaga sp. SL48]UJW78814.1 twin-arginine translocation pathway signal protein [Hydrogenophaga sp. SL48]